MNIHARKGRTVLFKASFYGRERQVRALLDSTAAYSCECNLRDNDGWTALLWAASEGREKVVEILVDSRVCDLDIQVRCPFQSKIFFSNELYILAYSTSPLPAHANITILTFRVLFHFFLFPQRVMMAIQRCYGQFIVGMII